MWSKRHSVFYSIQQNPVFSYPSSAGHSFLHLHVTHVLLKRFYLHSDLRSSLLHPWSCHSTPAHPGWGLCWCKWCRRRSASLRSAGVGRNSEVLQIDDSLKRNRDKLFFPPFLSVFWLSFFGIWQHTVLFMKLHLLILLNQQWVKCLCVISCL